MTEGKGESNGKEINHGCVEFNVPRGHETLKEKKLKMAECQ